VRAVGGVTMRGNRRGPWHIVDRLTGAAVDSFPSRRAATIAARVCNVELSPCRIYRPDHNGECLNCDEPLDGHTIEAVEAADKLASRVSKIR
jgi:hypothetical protein